ncbi:hypothetical protein BKA93DRAFT_36590 [Sparassis latifolia]
MASACCRGDLPPARRRLLQLYADAIASSAFLATRAEIIPSLHCANREKYVASLESAAERPLPDGSAPGSSNGLHAQSSGGTGQVSQTPLVFRRLSLEVPGSTSFNSAAATRTRCPTGPARRHCTSD